MGVLLTMCKLGVVCALISCVSSYPRPQLAEGPLPIPREGGYGPDNYFQYINVPAHKTFEWGYRRGNPDHNREEYLSQKDHTFKAKLKWHDGYGGHGEHYYDYNHGDAGYKAPKPAYHPGLHSEVKEQYIEAPAETVRI